MGHDLYLKQDCKRPLADECISGGICSKNHETDDESHISSNFNKFDKYWHVRNGHGHSGRVVAIQIRAVIKRLNFEGISSDIPVDYDEWSPTLEVFHYHMKRLLIFVEGYPNATFLSDQIWHFESDENDTDYDDDNNLNMETEVLTANTHSETINTTLNTQPKQTNIETYYQHPIKGNFKVYNFATASEVFAIASINGDPNAQQWLDFAQVMHDAPK
jgi:hypothetical protein